MTGVEKISRGLMMQIVLSEEMSVLIIRVFGQLQNTKGKFQ